MQASGLPGLIPFRCTSAVWGQSCLLVHFTSCIPPAPQQSPWRRAVASGGWKFWEPSFTLGGQTSLMAVTFLVYWYGRRYSHFTLEIDHLPRWHSGKESECRWCRRQGFRPWVRKIPWSRKWQPTPVFLPGEFKDREAWRVTVHGIAESGQSTQAASPGLKLLETEQSVGLWAARTLGFNCGWSWFAATLQGESLGSKHLSLLPSSLSPHLPSSPADTPHWPDSPGNLSLSRSASYLGTEHSGGWWSLAPSRQTRHPAQRDRTE